MHLLLTALLDEVALGSQNRYRQPIIRVAAVRGHTALLQRLLSYDDGSKVDKREYIAGTTALHASIILQQREAITILLRHGANMNIADNRGWSALH